MKDEEYLKQAISSLDGNFELVRELGRGATAVVYLLRDHDLDRDVALKVIRASFGADEEALARLQREARLVAQLAHPNIVSLYGTHHFPDGSFALLMEHVPGRNLKEKLQEDGPLSIRQTTNILKDIASALAYAHRRRIVHRDVKPENIYIDEEVGAARLADFGVARPWDQDARLTLPGASLGTPAYMSPEQIDGKEVDGRTDVYSLGMVGYEMLLGRHPWEGENVFTIIYRQKNEDLATEDLGLARAPLLARTLEKALQKDPAARWKSAADFLDHLTDEEDAFGPGPSGPASSDTLARPRPEAPPAGKPRMEEGLAPVDWSSVEPPGTRPVPVTHGPNLEVGEERESGRQPPLMPRPRKRRRRWTAALALLLLPASWAVYKWSSGPGEEWDSGGYAPTTPSPALSEGGEAFLPDHGAPGTLSPATGPEAEAPAGSLVPLGVIAADGDGFPLADTLVSFRVAEGDGILQAEEARTDPRGSAQVSLRLPNRAGSVTVIASLAGSADTQAMFEVSARPGEPRRVSAILGNGQTADPGETLPDLLGVRVVDEFGNPIPRAAVQFQVLQGGGRLSVGAAQTDDVGRAFTRWTLGTATGTQLAAAVVPGAEESLLTFRATARAAPQPEPQAAEETLEGPVAEVPAGPAPGPVLVVARTYSVGGGQVCHLSGGSPRCRGAGERGQGGDGSAAGLVGLALGVSHGCGLDNTGAAFCWGANGSGQLGDGTAVDHAAATPVGGSARFSLLAAGLSHTCGIGPEGRVFCWGRNLGGQLGDGSRTDRHQPVEAESGLSLLDLVAGWNHTCGLAAGGRTYCWGSNPEGQVGDGSRVDRLVPTSVSGAFQTLAAGAGHTCGIAGGETRCWGDNTFGQLGDGTTEDRSSPTPVRGLPGTPVALATGAMHSCALLTDRTTWCWGQNLHGQLGDGTTQNRTTPAAVSGGLDFISIFAGGGTTCGFTRDGLEYCWGLNQGGQLGDGSRANRSAPVRVGGNRP